MIQPPPSSSSSYPSYSLHPFTSSPRIFEKIPDKQNDVSHLQLRMPATIEIAVLALLRNDRFRKDTVHQAAVQTHGLPRKLLLPETSIESCRPSANDKRATAMLPREAFKYVRIREQSSLGYRGEGVTLQANGSYD